jgi:transaldolase
MLIAKTGRRAEDVIVDLCAVAPGIVFHQLTAASRDGLVAEAERFLSLAPGRVGLKVPCHLEGMRIVRAFADRATCAVTAVYSPAQAYLASEAGARFVIPYVNRAARQGVDALALVRQMAAVVEAGSHGSEVLAASVKSAEEAAAVTMAGARHLTLPWSVLVTLAEHPLTSQALAEFDAASRA